MQPSQISKPDSASFSYAEKSAPHNGSAYLQTDMALVHAGASSHDPALPAKRHMELLRLLRIRGQVSVKLLSRHFQISEDTIRRDLVLLAERGLLTRTHGGAVALERAVDRDATFMQRMSACISEKRRIARAACRLIRERETLALNGGSTTRYFAEQLNQHDLTIVTNNLSVPAALPDACARNVYVLGGRYERQMQATVGPMALSGLGLRVDCAVIGVGGISARDGLSTSLFEEALAASGMIAAARRTMVLADASKWGIKAFACIGPLEGVQVLVTDQGPTGELADALEKARVEVVVADEG
jgi:DeoR family transcriptional regulator, fructose operon transcriptional repressor